MSHSPMYDVIGSLSLLVTLIKWLLIKVKDHTRITDRARKTGGTLLPGTEVSVLRVNYSYICM